MACAQRHVRHRQTTALSNASARTCRQVALLRARNEQLAASNSAMAQQMKVVDAIIASPSFKVPYPSPDVSFTAAET